MQTSKIIREFHKALQNGFVSGKSLSVQMYGDSNIACFHSIDKVSTGETYDVRTMACAANEGVLERLAVVMDYRMLAFRHMTDLDILVSELCQLQERAFWNGLNSSLDVNDYREAVYACFFLKVDGQYKQFGFSSRYPEQIEKTLCGLKETLDACINAMNEKIAV